MLSILGSVSTYLKSSGRLVLTQNIGRLWSTDVKLMITYRWWSGINWNCHMKCEGRKFPSFLQRNVWICHKNCQRINISKGLNSVCRKTMSALQSSFLVSMPRRYILWLWASDLNSVVLVLSYNLYLSYSQRAQLLRIIVRINEIIYIYNTYRSPWYKCKTQWKLLSLLFV